MENFKIWEEIEVECNDNTDEWIDWFLIADLWEKAIWRYVIVKWEEIKKYKDWKNYDWAYCEKIRKTTTKKPKYKIGQKVVEMAEYNDKWVDSFIVIHSIMFYKWDYVYNATYHKNYISYLSEESLRVPTPIEVMNYYN